MQVDRFTAVTLTMIALIAVVSGPVVPAVDLTRDAESQPLYRGLGESLSVEQQGSYRTVSLPDRGQLVSAGDAYTLDLPAAEIAVEAGDDPITVVGELHSDLGTWRTTRSLDAGERETVTLSPGARVPTGNVSRDSYAATLVVHVVQGDRTYPVDRTNVTLTVDDA